MSQQISREASIPLQQHRRGNRLVEFALIFTIGFAVTSLLKLEPLARNSLQNHNGKVDLPQPQPQPQSNHSVGMHQFQSGMTLLSSNNTSTTVESLDRDHQDQDDADNSESDSESCLRPRRNSDAAVKLPLKLPFINLGMPKMGSTSLHTYFQCGGYESIHWECGKSPTMRGKRLFCADCIKSAIQAGLPPFSECNINKTVASYAQIDRGPENLVQVNYLNEIVGGVPNATFILTFRNMTKWYMSLTNWQSIYSEFNMRNRFQRANLIGLPTGVGRNVSEFRNFYCEYVTRVREEVAKYPGRHMLVEIDIEDPKVGWQLEEVFGVNRTCWGKKNTAKHNDKVSKEELQR